MGALILKNRVQVANFEYLENEYLLTGTVRTNDTDVITAIEGGNFYVFQEGESLKTNLNGVESSELGNLGVIVNDCISSLKTK